MPGYSLGYTDGKVLHADEVIKLGSTDGKVLGTILGNVDRIKLRIDVGIELGSLDGSFDGSNDGNIEGLFNEDSLIYTDGKVYVSGEGIKMVYTDGKVIGTIPGNVHGIIIGFDAGT